MIQIGEIRALNRKRPRQGGEVERVGDPRVDPHPGVPGLDPGVEGVGAGGIHMHQRAARHMGDEARAVERALALQGEDAPSGADLPLIGGNDAGEIQAPFRVVIGQGAVINDQMLDGRQGQGTGPPPRREHPVGAPRGVAEKAHVRLVRLHQGQDHLAGE